MVGDGGEWPMVVADGDGWSGDAGLYSWSLGGAAS